MREVETLRAVLDAMKGKVFPGGTGQMGASPISSRGEMDGLTRKAVLAAYELQRAELQREIADYLGYVPSHASIDEQQPTIDFRSAFALKPLCATAEMRNVGGGRASSIDEPARGFKTLNHRVRDQVDGSDATCL